MNHRPQVEIGRIVGAHALRGEVRVRYFADGPSTLLDLDHVWLGERREDPAAILYTVTRAGTGRGGEVRLALEGVGDRNAAEALRGRLVLIEQTELAPLPEDDFYWHELIGCRVVTVSGEEIGRVRELWDTGRHDLLVVDGDDGRQILIPTVREIMTRVDTAARRIEVEAIPGLIESSDESRAGAGGPDES